MSTTIPTEDEMCEDLIFAAKFAEAGVRTEHWYVASGALMEAAAYFVYEKVVDALHLHTTKFHGPSFIDPWSQRFDAKVPDEGIPVLNIPASKAGEDMGFLIHFDRDRLLKDGDCYDACEISTINTRHLTLEDFRYMTKDLTFELPSEETTKLGLNIDFWFRDASLAIPTIRSPYSENAITRKHFLRVPYKTLIACGSVTASKK